MGYNPINQVFDTLADLTSQKGTPTTTVYVSGQTSINDGNGGNYMWDDTNVASADGFKIVQVTGVTTGRWVRSKNSNYSTGQTTISTLVGTANYVVTHGLNYTPIKVFLQSRSQSAANSNYYVSAITTTTFTITLVTLPLIAGNNMIFDWLAVKQ